MTLLTLFSAPKAFTDPLVAVSQRNAIGSWKQLPGADVLLEGEEPGLAQAAAELGVRNIAVVEKNPNGVPLVSSMIALARANSDSEFLCIINADIILLPGFFDTVRQVQALAGKRPLKSGFVLVSQRWDLDVPKPIDFARDWDTQLQHDILDHGALHRPTGSDFFLFPRGCYNDVPDFAIGRAGWDNWMIYQARRQGWAVVDGTPSLTVIHQNHDYRHLPGGRPHYDHPDTAVNTQLAGGAAATRYTLLDVTHMLADGNLRRPARSAARTWRGLELLLRRLLFFLPESLKESLVRPRRWNKRLQSLFRRAQS